jgi:prevent-host-death family protein
METLLGKRRYWIGRGLKTAKCTLCSVTDSYSLTEARAHLGELVSRARYGHQPVVITEHGKPSVAIINVDDLADLEDRAALAAHYAARLAGRDGVRLADLNAALDEIDAEDGR